MEIDARFLDAAADPVEGCFDVFDSGRDGAEAKWEREANSPTSERGVLESREKHLRSAAGLAAAVDPEDGGTGDAAATHHSLRESGFVFKCLGGFLSPVVGGEQR